MSVGLIPKIAILFFSFTLMFTSVTDADFIDKKVINDNKMSATTLNFTNIDTATNAPIEKLFDVNGIVPSGFKIESVRLINEGQSNLYNKISTEVIGGDIDFCKALEVDLNYSNQLSFKGKLVNLSQEISALNPNTQADLIILIRLIKSDLLLQNKNCEFNLIINGFNQDYSKETGLRYARKISNRVVSGSWKQ